MPASGCTALPQLVLAVPMDYVHFTAHVRTSDWLAKFNYDTENPEARDVRLRHVWNKEYRPFVANPLEQLSRCASQLGAGVWRNACLEQLAQATRRGCTVIVFAHWKGCEILHEDLMGLTSVDAMERMKSAAPEPLVEWLRQRLRPTANLAEVLNEALEADLDDQRAEAADSVLESALTRRTRRRDRIDALLGGRLRRANQIEFMDGLYDCQSVSAAVASGFNGVLDLTTCTSSVLADYLLRAKANAFRIVQFEDTQDFLYHAHAVEVALTLHIRYAMPYCEARSIARATLEEAIRTAKPVKGGRG